MWIKCSERLPERSRRSEYSNAVIAFIESKSVQIAAIYDTMNDEWYCLFSEFTINGITHWQPLPEPPKDD